jgi:hypothetical protein
MLQALSAALGSLSLGGGNPYAQAPGSLGGYGTYTPGSPSAALTQQQQALSSQAGAAAALAAVAPTVSDLQAAGFASSTGLGPSAADPSPAVSAAAAMVADGCAFGAALASALSTGSSMVSAAGGVSAAVLASLEQLQETLACRQSSLQAQAQAAYEAAAVSSDRYGLLQGAAALLAQYPAIAGTNCPAGTGPLGSC